MQKQGPRLHSLTYTRFKSFYRVCSAFQPARDARTYSTYGYLRLDRALELDILNERLDYQIVSGDSRLMKGIQTSGMDDSDSDSESRGSGDRAPSPPESCLDDEDDDDDVEVIQEVRDEFTNVYVNNLDPKEPEAELYRLFEPFGEITSAVLKRDSLGRSFGFVNYKKPTDAARAVAALYGTGEVRKLYVARAQKKSEREQVLSRSYLKFRNFDPSMGDDVSGTRLPRIYLNLIAKQDIFGIFVKFGFILTCQVKWRYGNSTGSGYIHFGAVEAADAAIKACDNMVINKRRIHVYRKGGSQQVSNQLGGHYV